MEPEAFQSWRRLLASSTASNSDPGQTYTQDREVLGKKTGLRSGDILSNRFRIEEFLGSGGMGEVFAAQDLLLQTTIAIKVLSAELMASEAARRRLMREVKTARSVSHPNICRVFDFEETAAVDKTSVSFLTMELLHGETLSERLSHQPQLTQREAALLVMQLCDAFCALHKAGIVHRDFKAANVMLLNDSGELRAVVMDFGLAIAFTPEEDSVGKITRSGIAVGTPAYMAPEQIAGQPVTARADVYSLGLVMAEILTAITIDALLDRTSFPPRLSSAARLSLRRVRGHWAQIIDRCLAADPARRFASSLELQQALRAEHINRRPALLAGVVLVATVAAGSGYKVWQRWSTHGEAAGVIRVANEKRRGLIRHASTALDYTDAARQKLHRYDKADNLQSAISLLSEAINLDNTYAPAYAELAIAYSRRNIDMPDMRWRTLSLDCARQAVTLNPDMALGHVALGTSLQLNGDRVQATAEYRKAALLDPKDSAAYLGLAKCAAAVGKRSEADALFQRALQLTPDDWISWAEYGIYAYYQSSYGKAAGAFEKAEVLVPDSGMVHRNLGAIYSKLDRYDDAASAFQRALEIHPSAALYTNLGTIRYYQGRYLEAIPVMEKAVQLAADKYLYWGNLGDVYRLVPGYRTKAGEAYSIAIRLLREAIEKNPDNAELIGSLAVYLAHIDDRNAVRRELDLLLSLKNKSPSSLYKAALASELIGDRKGSLRLLAGALEGGYSVRDLRNEPDLVALRDDPEYQRLVLRAEARRLQDHQPGPALSKIR